MAGSVNKVIILGNLGANPEIKYLPSGQAVCEMRVATSERWMDKQTNQPQERTEWHRVTVWGKTAENCAKFLAKGQQVYAEGRLQTRSWDDKDGNKRYTTEIVADQVVFLRGSGGGQGGGGAGPGPGPGPGMDDMPPQPRSAASGAYGQRGGYGGGQNYGGDREQAQGGYGGGGGSSYGGGGQQQGYGGRGRSAAPPPRQQAPSEDVPPEDFGNGGEDDIPF